MIFFGFILRIECWRAIREGMNFSVTAGEFLQHIFSDELRYKGNYLLFLCLYFPGGLTPEQDLSPLSKLCFCSHQLLPSSYDIFPTASKRD